MTRLPDIALLRTLTALVAHKGISGASRATSTPKSTLARHLAQLEEIVATPLVDRARADFTLTETGRLVHEHAVRVLRTLGEMMAAAASTEPRGMLRVSTTYSLFTYALRPILPGFLERYPEIDLYIEAASMHRDLLDGAFDVAVRGGNLSGDDLIARRLGKVAISQYVAPGGGDSLFSVALSQSPTSGDRPRPRLTLNDPALVKGMVQDGHGSAWLPDYICADDIASGRLKRLSRSAKPGPEVFVLYRKTDVLAAKSRAFIDFLADHLGL